MKRSARVGVVLLALTLLLVGVLGMLLTFVAAGPETPATKRGEPAAVPGAESLPPWWAPYPEASVEVRAFFEDDANAAATIVVTSSAAMPEVVEFYRRLLQDAGYVLEQDHLRPGVAAVMEARHSDGSEVRLTAVPGSLVILYLEVRTPPPPTSVSVRSVGGEDTSR